MVWTLRTPVNKQHPHHPVDSPLATARAHLNGAGKGTIVPRRRTRVDAGPRIIAWPALVRLDVPNPSSTS